MKKFISAIALAFAAVSVFANGDKVPKPADKPSHECQGNSCNGSGPVDIQAIAKNWNTFNNQQKFEITLNLPPAERQQLMHAINDVKATSSAAVTGNTTTYESFSRNVNLASALSPDARGEVKMGEWSACGPRYVLPKDKDGKELPPETYVNHSHIPWLLGVLKEKDRVHTIVGPLPQFNAEEPFKEVTYKLGAIMAQRLKSAEGYFLYGHKAMIVGAVVAHSGASNVAGQKGSSGDTLGLGNSGGSGIPQVGAVISECLLDSGLVKPVTEPTPPPPVGKIEDLKTGVDVGAKAGVGVELKTDSAKVSGDIIGYAIHDKPRTCGGKPLPADKVCIPIRKKLEVLTGAQIRAIAESAAAAKTMQ